MCHCSLDGRIALTRSRREHIPRLVLTRQRTPLHSTLKNHAREAAEISGDWIEVSAETFSIQQRAPQERTHDEFRFHMHQMDILHHGSTTSPQKPGLATICVSVSPYYAIFNAHWKHPPGIPNAPNPSIRAPPRRGSDPIACLK